MKCEMCGSGSELFRTNIEGAEVNVCKGCSGFGKVIGPVNKPKHVVKQETVKPVPKRNEMITMIKPNYPQIIKDKRERRDLTQEELAKKIAEKTSVIHNLETGHLEPSMSLARKLEKFLGIKLVEHYEEESKGTSSGSSEVTIGDMLKIK